MCVTQDTNHGGPQPFMELQFRMANLGNFIVRTDETSVMTLNTTDRVIVALDHGLHWGVFEGFADIESTLRSVLAGDPDGVLASVSILRQYGDLLAEYPGVTQVGTLDLLYDSTVPGERADDEIHVQAFDVEAAARIGADAVKVCVVYGRENPAVLANNATFAADVAETARHDGLSTVLEPVLWGDRIANETDPELIEHAARLAVELGADVLKLYNPGPAKLSEIADHAPCPVYVAGGPGGESDRAVLETTAEAVEAGASGVIYGRKVWQHDDPAGMVEALDAVVSDGAAPSQALDHL